jgi:hypothetical protein
MGRCCDRPAAVAVAEIATRGSDRDRPAGVTLHEMTRWFAPSQHCRRNRTQAGSKTFGIEVTRWQLRAKRVPRGTCNSMGCRSRAGWDSRTRDPIALPDATCEVRSSRHLRRGNDCSNSFGPDCPTQPTFDSARLPPWVRSDRQTRHSKWPLGFVRPRRRTCGAPYWRTDTGLLRPSNPGSRAHR